jgi:ATP-dependent Clp protease ATP-binding subunit ClpB
VGKRKKAISEIRKLKAEIENLKTDEQRAERDGNLNTVAEIRYGKIPQTQKKLNDENLALLELQKEQKFLKEEVDDEDIAEVVSKWTGIPVARMLESETQKLLKMEEQLHKRVIGQDKAVYAVANAVRRSRSGLSDPCKPIGSFLFLGPTGVGKTELAKALAELLFDDEKNIVRIDMSEYMEKHSVSRLIGAPPGYVGFEEGGQLTESVRRRPYSVVLFDEVEKANSEIFNIMLQLFDDGRLTDGQGRTVDFKNTVVIMTSNVGSHLIGEEKYEDNIKTKIMGELNNFFKPEFLNRIDEIIIFNKLLKSEITKVIDVQIKRFESRLIQQKIIVNLTESAKSFLTSKGYDQTFGARPLKRTIQNYILNPLASKLLSGEFKEGDNILIDVLQKNTDILEFTKK